MQTHVFQNWFIVSEDEQDAEQIKVNSIYLSIYLERLRSVSDFTLWQTAD